MGSQRPTAELLQLKPKSKLTKPPPKPKPPTGSPPRRLSSLPKSPLSKPESLDKSTAGRSEPKLTSLRSRHNSTVVLPTRTPRSQATPLHLKKRELLNVLLLSLE